jgi:inorganic pyrophosphatase
MTPTRSDAPPEPGSLFWDRLDLLIRSKPIVIDRRRGTPHPRYPEFVYPVDYGYLDGTLGPDGNPTDVWVGTGAPARVTAVACAVDVRKMDAEIKILVSCLPEEIRAIRETLNRGGMSALFLTRPREIPPATASPENRA